MDISEVECIMMVGWMAEEDLPDWVDEEVYEIIYPSKRVQLGTGKVEFPFIKLCGKTIFLIERLVVG